MWLNKFDWSYIPIFSLLLIEPNLNSKNAEISVFHFHDQCWQSCLPLRWILFPWLHSKEQRGEKIVQYNFFLKWMFPDIQLLSTVLASSLSATEAISQQKTHSTANKVDVKDGDSYLISTWHCAHYKNLKYNAKHFLKIKGICLLQKMFKRFFYLIFNCVIYFWDNSCTLL